MKRAARFVPCWSCVAACAGPARLPLEAGIGPNPQLPPPEHVLSPDVNVAKANGWPAGTTPAPAPGLKVNAFASGLDHPRWLYVLPNGDVLVAETNGPGTDPDRRASRAYFFKKFKKKAGSAVPSANRITLLRDADGDGVAEVRSTLLSGLRSPFGMALVGKRAVRRQCRFARRLPLPARPDDRRGGAAAGGDLPSGRNHHWTKSLVASPDGRWLYVGVGSNSNVGENGMAMEQGRAAIWQIDPRTGAQRESSPAACATRSGSPSIRGAARCGPRSTSATNSAATSSPITSPRSATAPSTAGRTAITASMWTSGSSRRGRISSRARSRPIIAIGPHVAALGLTFSTGQRLGPAFAQGAFVGEHGSWNRKPPSGYKVVFVPFAGAQPSGMPIDVLTGFMVGDKAFGRPVGVQIARDGIAARRRRCRQHGLAGERAG